jgi:hypothetical protein
MTSPLSPASNQPSPLIHLPTEGRPVIEVTSPSNPAANNHLPGDQGEKLQLSGALDASSRSNNNGELASGVAEAALAALGRSSQALARIQNLVQQGQVTPEAIHPHAMQILEATSTQHLGISPLERNGVAIQSGATAVPSYILAGEGADSLVEISSLVPATTSSDKLQVSRDNVEWAKSQYREALGALDTQRAYSNIADTSPSEKPSVPSGLSADMHKNLQPGRIVGLLSG